MAHGPCPWAIATGHGPWGRGQEEGCRCATFDPSEGGARTCDCGHKWCFHNTAETIAATEVFSSVFESRYIATTVVFVFLSTEWFARISAFIGLIYELVVILFVSGKPTKICCRGKV